jgi:hypothetical protein
MKKTCPIGVKLQIHPFLLFQRQLVFSFCHNVNPNLFGNLFGVCSLSGIFHSSGSLIIIYIYSSTHCSSQTTAQFRFEIFPIVAIFLVVILSVDGSYDIKHGEITSAHRVRRPYNSGHRRPVLLQ